MMAGWFEWMTVMVGVAMAVETTTVFNNPSTSGHGHVFRQRLRDYLGCTPSLTNHHIHVRRRCAVAMMSWRVL